MMKKLLLAVFLLFAAVGITALTSCNTATQFTPNQKIIGKWTPKNAIGNYTVQGSNRKDTTQFTSDDYFNFKADGTLAIVVSQQAYNGNWVITNNKLFITNTNYIDYAQGFDLAVLTTTKLQLYYLNTNTTLNTITEQTLNLTK